MGYIEEKQIKAMEQKQKLQNALNQLSQLDECKSTEQLLHFIARELIELNQKI